MPADPQQSPPSGMVADLELREGGEHVTRLHADPLSMLQVTRVVIRHPQWQRVAGCAWLELGEHLRDVLARGCERGGPIGVRRVIAEQVAVLLERGAAPGGVCDDRVHLGLLEGIDRAPRHRLGVVFDAGVHGQSPAASLRRRDDHVTPFGPRAPARSRG